MKATGTYHEGTIALNSGYLWSGLIYNLSVTISLYSLGLFWVCMNNDLKPFRPVPKFLCIKLIIFASYWQGFFLAILVWLGAIPGSRDGDGKSPDSIAASIQDFLICVEMPAFAVAHWYAFSWHDFADNRVSAARMPVWHAARDAFGVRDLIEDSKETFKGDKYRYRIFDSGDKIMAHEASRSRLARLKEGMRYERGGKGKYWIPKPDEINQTTPLLGANGSSSRRSDSLSPNGNGLDELIIDADEEILYEQARALEFGDWNVSFLLFFLLSSSLANIISQYPVITVNEPSRPRYLSPHPSLYHHTPTGSLYQQSPAGSTAALNPDSALARRMKRAPEGPEMQVEDRKGKRKEISGSHGGGSKSGGVGGRDPLDIAYGPIVDTHTKITEDDFKVEDEDEHREGSRQVDGGGNSSQQDGESPIREESRHCDRGSETESPNPQYGYGAEEFQNVWGR